MDLFISMSKSEANSIYDYLFADREKELAINADGCDFVHTLSWPLMMKTDDPDEQRPFLFASSSVIWFINFVCKLDLRNTPDGIKKICRKLTDAYIKVLDAFIVRDNLLDPDKQLGVDPWEVANLDPFGKDDV